MLPETDVTFFMDVITIITLLLSISAFFSYLNQRVLRLPPSIGVMLIAVILSVLMLTIGRYMNFSNDWLTKLAENINFSNVLLNVMLAFLLFATAMHFDYRKLKVLRLPIILLSTAGVLISTFVFGILAYWILPSLGVDISFSYCLLFGAIVAPTDPIAVAAILKRAKMPSRLDTIISGESMFNDAVSLILFVVLLDITALPSVPSDAGSILKMLGLEVLGGALVGLAAGLAGHLLIRTLRDFQTVLLITIALVLVISLLAHHVHASVPLAAVTSGLIIGNQTYESGHPAGKPLARIWSLLDEVLNTILFVMIGLQLIVLPFVGSYWLVGIIGIGVALVARAASLLLPTMVSLRKVKPGNLFLLTWAGVRGGISIAMALILPPAPYRELVLSGCYIIVLFSIIVQGLTLGPAIKKIVTNPEEGETI